MPTREKVIFEYSQAGRGASDQWPHDPGAAPLADLPAALRRGRAPLLPEVGELEAVRHFTRLSQLNFSIDTHFYPLGSCTMKYNPKACNQYAMLPPFLGRHPLAPDSHGQGFLACMYELQEMLKEVTGMQGVALSPMAGAQGEFAGVAMIRAYHRARGDLKRNEIIVPEAAHGTNPATATMCGCVVREIPVDSSGDMDLAALKAAVGPNTAGIMLTNPSTLGVFERGIEEVARVVHEAGGLLYYDGANLNAILGKVRPGDMGFDCMHMNLHKTFSTPHGGGGPGAGPVVLSQALAPFAPAPWIVHAAGGLELVEEAAGEAAQAFGRMCAFQGQMGMFVRAYAYMRSHGADGLRQVAEDAVLNANYIKARLSAEMTPAFPDGPCMHEALFDDTWLEDTSVTTLDFAKAMIDEGFHPMTMYFPLVVHGAMLIEPTETESKRELDRFCDALLALAKAAKAGDADRFKGAPYLAPLGRLDETQAARKPKLTWRAESTGVAPAPLAAE
jgi:glycine dehydrogenase subunit 2